MNVEWILMEVFLMENLFSENVQIRNTGQIKLEIIVIF